MFKRSSSRVLRLGCAMGSAHKCGHTAQVRSSPIDFSCTELPSSLAFHHRQSGRTFSRVKVEPHARGAAVPCTPCPGVGGPDPRRYTQRENVMGAVEGNRHKWVERHNRLLCQTW